MIDDCILPLLGVEFWGGGGRGWGAELGEELRGKGLGDDLPRMKSMQMWLIILVQYGESGDKFTWFDKLFEIIS